LNAHASTINGGSTDIARNNFNRRTVSFLTRFNAWKRSFPLRNQDEVNSEEEEDDDPPANFKTVLLPLPSNGVNADMEQFQQLCLLESKLRRGQAFDALKQLRTSLALRLALLRGATRNVRGQRENLRSQAAINRIDSELSTIASRYRAAYSALITLNIPDAQKELQPLLSSDISTSNAFQLNRGVGRGFQTKDVTWIWRMSGIDANIEDNNWLSEGQYLPLSVKSSNINFP
jgi:hypothetical protein